MPRIFSRGAIGKEQVQNQKAKGRTVEWPATPGRTAYSVQRIPHSVCRVGVGDVLRSVGPTATVRYRIYCNGQHGKMKYANGWGSVLYALRVRAGYPRPVWPAARRDACDRVGGRM